MVKSLINLQGLTSELAQLGLLVFGSTQLTAELIPAGSDHFLGRNAILLGNAGGKMWEAFAQSDEYADKLPNPLDRWTRSSVDRLTSKFGVETFYPFDEPFWPFQRIASEVSGMQASPLGMCIHPLFGLWQAYRALLIFGTTESIPSKFIHDADVFLDRNHPCDHCEGKPCLTACPVTAFEGGTLLVDKCFRHLESKSEPDCMYLGCRARDACPVGTEYRYSDEQIQFHMAAFKK